MLDSVTDTPANREPMRPFVYLTCEKCSHRQRAKETPRESGHFVMICANCGRRQEETDVEPDTLVRIGARTTKDRGLPFTYPELVISSRYLGELEWKAGDKVEITVDKRGRRLIVTKSD